MNRKLSYIFLALSAVLAISAVCILIFKPGYNSQNPNTTQATGQDSNNPQKISDIGNDGQKDPTISVVNPTPVIPSTNPAELLEQIANALKKNDIDTVKTLIGKDKLGPDELARLTELFQKGKLRPLNSGAVREVGELELNRRARWAIELEEENKQRSRILFDMRREGENWIIEKTTLPSADPNSSDENHWSDPLNVADSFIQAVLVQDFDKAFRYVDAKVVSDAKIAALCILFEEGEYRIKSQKPLRAMFTRPDAVGYIANVETKDAATSGQFALNLTLKETKWLISEINLDKLLAEYAGRVADGDIYYSPLVRNPEGGETLALYFEFDEDSMSDRTRRQLEIVAAVLKQDANKKITLSGHTDALGSKDYNDNLSANRAGVVRDFLVEAGVPATQITTIAKGESQPRRPNLTETGDDNPDGRRANRRTEIYLDF